MDAEFFTELENMLRDRQELEGDLGELCVEGTYYWVVPKVYTDQDIESQKEWVKKHKHLVDINGGQE